MRIRASIVALLASMVVMSGCEDVSVTPVPVETVRIQPADVDMLEGEVRPLDVRHLGPGGEQLGGRPTEWSVDDPDVASVDGQGRLTGRSVGNTRVRARSEGREGSADVRVRIGPRIELDPVELELTGPAGSGDPVIAEVAVSNAGNGALDALNASIGAPAGGSPPDWISAELDSGGAPVGLTVTVRLEALTPGGYDALVIVDDPAARNGPVMLPVALEVFQPPPVIGLSPSSVAFNSSAGSREPASQDVRIENEGGGTLIGLDVDIRYTQGRSGWLQASLDGTNAPASLSLEASARDLGEGEYRAVVRVSAPDAEPGFAEVGVAFSVGPAGVDR